MKPLPLIASSALLLEFLCAYPVQVIEEGNKISLINEQGEFQTNATAPSAATDCLDFISLGKSDDEREAIIQDFFFLVERENFIDDLPEVVEDDGEDENAI